MSDQIREESDIEYEWATVPDGHRPIPWGSESLARHANAVSKAYPSGEHLLVRRAVQPWIVVRTNG